MPNSDMPGASPPLPRAIPCQRALFDLPDDLVWLNCAQHSPALNAVYEAGMAGLALKRHPWRLGPRHYQDDVERLRGAFASLIGASAAEVALVPSASYGLSTAARNLPLREGERILVLADQFPSNVYPWRELARRRRGEVLTLERPEDGDWTRVIAEALDERVAILATPHYHWTDGSLVDLATLAPKVRDVGAALVLDLSQSWGVVPLDLSKVRPDFAVAVAYKWLLGPYRFTFLYAAPHRQGGEPLEQAWSARVSSADSSRLTEYRDELLPGARR
jgi:selenocysteine lyase/cysteine desulfurase